MAKIKSIIINNAEIGLITKNKDDYISLTDMAKFKNAEATGLVISHWMSTRYTIEYMGIWERLNNPDFNVTEFSYIKSYVGLNSFRLTAKEWRDANPDLKGNIRDYASINELICCSHIVSTFFIVT